MTKSSLKEEKYIFEGKMFAVLSYLSILCIIPLVFKRENSFVLNHGKQGLVIFVGEVAIFIVHIILGLWILRIGMFIFGVFSFIGIISVLKGQSIKLPLVSDIADKIIL
ncbi:MAG: hypothetical protein P9X22_04515 [Candidatus Zapsychrus exili]|nr:hypothetical protein [Candidatus Zapsychrus exili]